MYKNKAITDVEAVENSIEIRTTSKNIISENDSNRKDAAYSISNI